jgi:hypothetical protein
MEKFEIGDNDSSSESDEEEYKESRLHYKWKCFTRFGAFYGIFTKYNQVPLISIGPHWNYTLALLLIINIPLTVIVWILTPDISLILSRIGIVV